MKSLAAKVVLLFGLVLVLVFALTSVRGVLEDRLRYREEALASVERSLAGPQRVAGVVLVVPYTERWTEEQGSGADRRRVEQSSRRERIVLKGEVADPANPPSGCYFHPRCRYATDRCRTEEPALREVAPQRYAACCRASPAPIATPSCSTPPAR